MDYLKLVRAVRMFPKLSDADMVQVLELMEVDNKPTSTKALAEGEVLSKELIERQPLKFITGASGSLTTYLKEHGFKPARILSNGTVVWNDTPRVNMAVRAWLNGVGTRYIAK